MILPYGMAKSNSSTNKSSSANNLSQANNLNSILISLKDTLHLVKHKKIIANFSIIYDILIKI